LGKQVKLLTVVIVFVQAQAKETHIVLGQTLSKATGVVILTHQITCHAANGSAKEVSQLNNTMMKPKTKAAKQAKVGKVMSEYKAGTLHSGANPKGPKKAPVVKSRKQAVAIALSEAGMSKRK